MGSAGHPAPRGDGTCPPPVRLRGGFRRYIEAAVARPWSFSARSPLDAALVPAVVRHVRARAEGVPGVVRWAAPGARSLRGPGEANRPRVPPPAVAATRGSSTAFGLPGRSHAAIVLGQEGHHGGAAAGTGRKESGSLHGEGARRHQRDDGRRSVSPGRPTGPVRRPRGGRPCRKPGTRGPSGPERALRPRVAARSDGCGLSGGTGARELRGSGRTRSRPGRRDRAHVPRRRLPDDARCPGTVRTTDRGVSERGRRKAERLPGHPVGRHEPFHRQLVRERDGRRLAEHLPSRRRKAGAGHRRRGRGVRCRPRSARARPEVFPAPASRGSTTSRGRWNAPGRTRSGPVSPAA